MPRSSVGALKILLPIFAAYYGVPLLFQGKILAGGLIVAGGVILFALACWYARK